MMNPDGSYSKKYEILATDADHTDSWKLSSLLSVSQETANDQCKQLGAGRRELLASGLAFILIRNYAVIDRYPSSGDTVTVTTWPRSGSRHILTRYFKIDDEKGNTAAKIASEWALFNTVTRKLTPGDKINDKMPDTSGIADILEIPGRYVFREEEGEALPEVIRIRPQYSDLDVLGHVNNTKYVDWISNALGASFFNENMITSLDIRYVREVREDRELELRLYKRESGCLAKGFNNEGELLFEAVLSWKRRE